MLAPGEHGIRLVEAEAKRDELPQTLDVRLAQHLPRPTRGRRAHAAPVDLVIAMK
jgi:hypothetical protein